MNEKYYEKGSERISEVTAVLLKKLEQRRKLTSHSERLVIVLVGLPGRGKSFIARKLQSFLTWRGNDCTVFNVGKYRRQVQADYNAQQEKDVPQKSVRDAIGACDANFFDSHNPQANEMRQKSAELAMKDMLQWLDEEDAIEDANMGRVIDFGSKANVIRSRIAIFDATNSTVARRQWVLEECTDPVKRNGKKTGCIFVESICDDQELLDENFRFKVQNSPDFQGMTEEEAIADLRRRCQKYEEQYEPVADDKQSYIKIFNLSSKLLVNHIYGRMAKVIVPSLMSWNIGSRPIYLLRAGQTMDEIPDGTTMTRPTRGEKLGAKGIIFQKRLAKFIESEGLEFAKKTDDALKMAFAPRHRETGTSVSGIARDTAAWYPEDDEVKMKSVPFHCHVMSSTLPRAIETATWDSLPFYIHELPNLNPLDKGDFSNMELETIKEHHPEWYAQLEKDPFLTRFPGGECYADLIHRLETCIIDMEQQVNMVCVVSHVSVLQVLIAYFRRSPIHKCTSIEIPLHSVVKFTPVTGGGWTESIFKLCPEDDDTDIEQTASDECKTPIWGDHSRVHNSSSIAQKSLLIPPIMKQYQGMSLSPAGTSPNVPDKTLNSNKIYRAMDTFDKY